MTALRNDLTRLQKEGAALGHFNVADLVLLKAVLAAAAEVRVPVLLGASEGERAFFGTRELAALVKSMSEESDLPIFLNADHTHSLTAAMEAANAGFDAVGIDFSALPFEQNVARAKEAVEAIKTINPAILVEGEIGDIGTGSEIHEPAQGEIRILTTPEEARQFVHATGIDVLAPAVGNRHGMLKSMVQGKTRKHLDIERIAQIKKASGVFLTLHGGSGTDDEDLLRAIAAGINIIHINTELRVAWRRSLEDGLVKQPNEVVPYRILPSVVDSVRQVVSSRLRLFNARRASETAVGESAALPGVPTAQEQHHHLAHENPYVKVFEVEVGPHDTTLMHYHLHDYIYIVFGDAALTDTVAGKPEVKAKVPDLTVGFSPGHAHVAANNGETAFRNITIELLRPQGDMKMFYPTINDALTAGTPDEKGIRQVNILETNEMRGAAVGLAADSSWSPAHDDHDRLVVMLDKIDDTSGAKEKNLPFPPGMLAWVPAGKSWKLHNRSRKEMKLMVLEFKDRQGSRVVLENATQRFVDELNARNASPLSQISLEEARAGHARTQDVPVVKLPAHIEDRTIAVISNKNLLIRIVRPKGSSGTLPAVMYFHGGGFVLGDRQDWDRLLRDLAHAANAAIVFVEYSRSPEARYPVALEEAYEATRWVAENGREIKVDGTRLAVAGDSAGGNMVAAVTLLAKQRGGPRLDFQLMFYPNTDASFSSDSFNQFASGYFLSREDMEWFLDQYVPDNTRRAEPTATPLNAPLEQLTGLPPALLITAESDVLRDEGEAYAQRLMKAGVVVTATRYLGTIHGFVTLNRLADTPAARAAIVQAGAALQNALGLSEKRVAA